MPIINKKDWDKGIENNKDEYGKAVYDVAREVMRLLDEVDDFNADDLITKADHNINAGGITGFMAGCAAQIITHCHSRGEEFRRSWNAEIGKTTGQENSAGVLNPALIRLGK